MKKLFLVLLASVLFSCASDQVKETNTLPSALPYWIGFSAADYTLLIDYSADQDNLPFPEYAAAYLVNTTDVTMVFQFYDLERWGPMWGSGYLSYKTGSLAELMFDVPEGSEALVLKPNEKARIFSALLNSEDRVKYPYSVLVGYVYVDGEKRSVIAYPGIHYIN
jgi:hypothetical protein